MGIFDSLYNKPPVAKKEFTPRDNSTLGLSSKNGNGSGMFSRKNPVAKENTTGSPLYSGHYSGAAPTAKVIGNVFGTKEVKKGFGLSSRERIAKAGTSTFGKNSFTKRDALVKVAKLIDEGKYDQIPGATPETVKVFRNNKTAKTELRSNIGRALGGQWDKGNNN